MMKTKKLIACLSSVALAATMTGCASSANLPAKPTDKSCKDWDWDSEKGVYECDERSSSHYGHYYYGGAYHSSQNLQKNSAYKSYKSSSSFKGTSGSGFGRGATSTGG